MTSYEAGSAHLTILPATQGFAKRLKAELAGVKQDVTVPAKVEVDQRAVDGLNKALQALPIMVLDADSRPADREVASLRDRIATLSDQRIGIDISGDDARAEVAAVKEDLAQLAAPAIKLDVDISEATDKATALDKRLAEMRKSIAADTPQLDLDIRAAEAKASSLRSRIEELSAKDSSPQVDLQIATAEAQLGRVTGQLDALAAKKVSPEVRADAAAAEAELTAVRAILDGLQGRKAEVAVLADTAGALTALAGVEKALSRVDGQRITANVDVDTGSAFASLGALALGLDSARTTVTAELDLEVGPALGRLAMVSAGLLAVPALAGAAAYGIGAIAAALVPAAGAALLLPGAIAGAVVVVGALKVATSGVGDTLKLAFDPTKAEQFTAALAKLSPEAQTAVRAVQGLGPALNSVKMAAQDALFTGLAPMISSLGSTLLPIVEERFARIGGAVNYAATEVGTFLMSSYGISTVKTIGDAAASTFENLMMAVAPLAGAFLVVGSIAMPILEQMTVGAGGVAGRLASWVGSAEGIQTITGWIYGALDVLRTLGGVLSNVGSIFGSIMSAASTAGGNVLTTLRMVTGEVATFLSSADGQTALVTLFTSIRAAADAAMPGVRVILDALGYLITSLAPMLPAAGGAFSALVGAARPLFDLLVGLVSFALPPLLQMITDCPGLFIGLAIAVGIVSTAFSVLRTVTSIYAAVQAAMAIPAIASMVTATWGWVTALWAQAAAMVAAYWPILLVIAGIGLLVAAVIYAWNNFSWFRDIVTAVWSGIVAAATWAWTTILQPIFSAIWAAVQFVGGVFVWLWQSVIVPAWNAIAGAVSWAWNTVMWPILQVIGQVLATLGAIIFTILVAPFIIAWNIISAIVSWAWTNVIWPTLQFLWQGIQNLAAVMVWFWQNVVVPVWNAIAGAIAFVWNAIIKIVWDAMMFYINNVIIPVMNFLYYNVILPIWNAIGAAISFVWNSIILPIWNALVWVINNVLIPAVQFLYYNVIKPVWDAIGAAISFVWTNVIKPAFDAVWGGLQWLGDRFKDATDRIGQIWNMIRGFLAKPINFMIDVVWNRGIVPAWNAVAGLVGLGPIQPLGLIPEFAEGGPVARRRDFAAGGTVTGGRPGRDSVPAWVMPGEVVWSKRAVDNAGGPSAVQSMHLAARSGADVRAAESSVLLGYARRDNVAVGNRDRLADGGPVLRFAEGGLVAFGRRIQGMGYDVSEHPLFGGVAPVHGRTSLHYSGQAIDVNKGAGTSPAEQAALGQIVPMAKDYGLRTIFMVKDHFNHAHFDEGAGASLLGRAGQFAGQIGSAISTFFKDKARAAFDGITNPAINSVRRLVGDPPPAWRGAATGLATKARDTVRDFVFRKADEKDAAASAGGGGAAMGPPTAGQLAHAREIGMAAKERGIGRDGFVIALMTGLQESGLRILANRSVPASLALPNEGVGGDHDSVGIFQQRQAGWGTLQQRMNARASAGMFLNKLGRGPYGDYGAAAQRVQVSAFPGAYSKWRAKAEEIAGVAGFDDGGLAYGKGLMMKNVMAPERVLPPQETQAYPTLTRLTQQLEAGRVPAASLAGGAAQARSASLGVATGGGLPSEMRLSGGQLRILGPDLVEIVDGRLELVADKLTDGRMGP